MKILITGTHFTPAQATIEELKKYEDVELIYLGRKTTREGDKSQSAESKILPKLGVEFLPIIAGRFSREFSIYSLTSLFKIPVGFLQAFYYLLTRGPDVVLSFGGYVGVPVVFWAYFLSIPVIVHEQTLVPSLANSIGSFFADKIALSFNTHPAAKNKKSMVLGNPIRSEILNPTNSPDNDIRKIVHLAKDTKLPLVLVTGGNQGAHILNQKIYDELFELNKNFVIVHQTGDSKFKDFEKLLENRKNIQFPKRYLVKKWIDDKDFGYLLKFADLAVSRAGINTLLELSRYKIPTIAVPIPFIFNNEQVVNAKYFEKIGLADFLDQEKFIKESLTDKIKQDVKKINPSGESIDKAVKADAAKTLALETILLAYKNN